VDLTPVIEASVPFLEYQCFPLPNARWFAKNKLAELNNNGVDAVAKGDFDWKKSYVTSEFTLLKGIDEDGGCRKKALRIMKSLAEDLWATNTKPVMSTYHLKVRMLSQCWDCTVA